MFFEEQKGGKWEKREQSFNNFRFGFFCVASTSTLRWVWEEEKKCKNIFKDSIFLKEKKYKIFMVSKFWDMMMHLTSKKKVHGHENMKLHMSIRKPVFYLGLRWKVRRKLML